MSVAIRIPVVDSSQPGEARRVAVSMAQKLGFDETLAGKVAIVVTEGATNLVKHGGGGEVLLLVIERGEVRGLEVIALDKGHGIADLRKSLQDGQSTAGTSGSGLGAIARLSTWHDVYTLPGRGTAVISRFWPSKVPELSTHFSVEGFSVPLAGEQFSGDEWAVRHDEHGCTILMVDGLGHGLAASDAARAAVLAFQECPQSSAVQCMELIHGRLRSTRGAAAALTTIHKATGRLTFIGVGNIAGSIIDDEACRNVVSMSGTMGHNVRVLREFSYPWTPDSRLILHSDGVSGRWDMSTYPGLLHRAPGLAAAVLYRDKARGNDDASVVIARQGGIS